MKRIWFLLTMRWGWKPFLYLTTSRPFRRSKYFTFFATERTALMLIRDPGPGPVEQGVPNEL